MIKGNSKRAPLAALAAASALLLTPACSEGDRGDSATGQPSGQTLAALIESSDDLSVVADAISDAGLADVFEGTAAYTFLTPTDEAFEGLGEAGDDLRSPEQRAAVVAILRDHIVPGYLTRDDIARAIELDDDKRVEMRTMGARTIVFTTEGDSVVVQAEDGANARLMGEPLLGSNGVAIPVDGLLRRLMPPEA